MARKDLYRHVINERRLLFVLFLIGGYILPYFLILFGIIPYEYRFETVGVYSIVLLLYAIARGHSLFRLGIRFDNLFKSTIIYTIVSMCIVLLLYFTDCLGLIQNRLLPDWNNFYLFYIFISAPAQEFVYRSLLFAEMRYARIRSPFLNVIISAATFSFLHIFYANIVMLSITFVIGIIWGILYVKFPNYFAVSLSHAILGAFSLSQGLI